MKIVISDTIRAKLHAKHGVSPKDVDECFANRTGKLLLDASEERRDPPTYYFIAPNNHKRLLKVCFVLRNGAVFLRTCFPPSAAAIDAYQELGKPTDF